MIIVCINCNKKFSVESQLIPDEGRNIQCGSCNHIWFFDKNIQNSNKLSSSSTKIDTSVADKKNTPGIKTEISFDEALDNTNSKEIESKIKFNFNSFLSYILIFIVSFVALLIILDTFKSPLYKIYPNLEFLLFNFYETLKDINLFIRDLI
jgi:predicted Zn finger-like uncharacterized protein